MRVSVIIIAVSLILALEPLSMSANIVTKLISKITAAAKPKPKPKPCPPLVITTKTIPNGVVGVPYSFQLQTTGGCASVTPSVTPSVVTPSVTH